MVVLSWNHEFFLDGGVQTVLQGGGGCRWFYFEKHRKPRNHCTNFEPTCKVQIFVTASPKKVNKNHLADAPRASERRSQASDFETDIWFESFYLQRETGEEQMMAKTYFLWFDLIRGIFTCDVSPRWTDSRFFASTLWHCSNFLFRYIFQFPSVFPPQSTLWHYYLPLTPFGKSRRYSNPWHKSPFTFFASFPSSPFLIFCFTTSWICYHAPRESSIINGKVFWGADEVMTPLNQQVSVRATEKGLTNP